MNLYRLENGGMYVYVRVLKMTPKSAIQNRCGTDSFGFESWWKFHYQKHDRFPTKKMVFFCKGYGTPAISGKSRLVKYYFIWPLKLDLKQVKSGVFQFPHMDGRDQTMQVLFCSSKCNAWEV